MKRKMARRTKKALLVPKRRVKRSKRKANPQEQALIHQNLYAVDPETLGL